MWRTAELLYACGNGGFPLAIGSIVVWCAGRKRPALNAMEALLSVPHYCVGLYKCIEWCIEAFLRSVAL